jgi:hypothetical protein
MSSKKSWPWFDFKFQIVNFKFKAFEKKYTSYAECGLRLRLRPRRASAPEGEPSGSERLWNAAQ